MFDINITVLIQLANFIITLVGLNFLLIRPVRGMLQKRRDLASGMLTDAETFAADAAEKLKNYEAVLLKAREDAAMLRDTRKSEGAVKAAELLEAAQREAQEFLQASREETRMAAADTADAMRRRIPDLAKMAAAQLLGKSKRPSAA